MSTRYDTYIGKTRSGSALIDPWNTNALSAVLDLPVQNPGDNLPSLWHWLYFLETAPRSQIGADGHPVKGGFLPPIENPRRMFAGARTSYFHPLLTGKIAQLSETVKSIVRKEGKQGEMYIVTVYYEYTQDDQLCISEERDFIYLPGMVKKAAPTQLDTTEQSVPDSPWQLDFETEPVTLFRFSSLTFNSHRIHYDLQHAQEVEGYPQLVVHGPLSAILLSECIRIHSQRCVRSFSFKALNPIFCGQRVRIRSQGDIRAPEVALQAYTPAGETAVKASACFYD